MSEFGGGRTGPIPTEGRQQVRQDHEQEIREQAERDHAAAEVAHTRKRRWRWRWRRRARG
jgi:hypothetical protein